MSLVPQQTQFRRGTTAENNAFTGAVGEVTVDTTTKTLRLHDGVTVGGFHVTSNTAVQTLTNKILASPVISGGADINLDADDNITVDGRTNPRTITLGAYRQNHTAGIQGTRAIHLDIDSAGFDDTTGMVVRHDLAGSSAEIRPRCLDLQADVAGMTNAHINFVEVQLTGDLDPSARADAIDVRPGIAPIHHHSGAAVAAGKAFTFDDSGASFTDVTTEFGSAGTDVQIFVGDDDQIYIGDVAQFTDIEVILAIVATNPGVKPTFEYSQGAAAWGTLPVSDGTNGFRENGSVAFAKPGDWATDTVNGDAGKFWVRITRTTNSLGTVPTEDTIKIIASVEYEWDENGNLIVNSVTANNWFGISAADVSIPTGVGTPTINQVQEYINNTGSSGFFLGGELSDGGAGTLDVAAGSGFIRTTNDENAELQSFKWSASAGIAVTDNTTQYVYVDDAGTISVSTNQFLEAPDLIQIGVVTKESGTIDHFFSLGVRLQESIGAAGRFIRNVHGISRNNRLGGLIFGQSGDANRDVTMTAGQLEWGRTSYPISSFDTSGADTFSTYSASGLEAATASQFPNTQYDNAGTLTTMTNNRWANLFFFLEPDDHITMVYGRAEFTSQALAEGEGVPSTSLPTRISDVSILVARFTFQESANSATISSAFDALFANAGVTDHSNLASLAWTSAGHTGTATNLAGFNGAGAAAEYTLSGTGTEIPTTVSPVFTGIVDLSAGGAYFGTAAAANLLDDYEEGTWTPVLSDGTNTDATVVTAVGTYTRIGRVVHVNGHLVISSLGSISGPVRINGIPFTPAAVSGSLMSAYFGSAAGMAIAAGTNVTGFVSNGLAFITLRLWDATAGPTQLQASEFSATGNINVDAIYYV